MAAEQEPSFKFSSVGASLVHAFSQGRPWTPNYYAAWLKRHADGALPASGSETPLRPALLEDGAAPKGAPQVPLAPSPEISADELIAILVKFRNEVGKHERDHRETTEKGVRLALRGVEAKGLTVTNGPLNLTALVFPTPLAFPNCNFPDGIVLDNARLGSLRLDGSVFPSLHGDALRVDGDLGLRALKKTGWIYLRDARIAGLLSLSHSTLDPTKCDKAAPTKCTVECNRIEVGNTIFLDESFTAQGEVSLVGARIGSQLVCKHGTFLNPSGNALTCDSAQIGTDVFLNDGFSAQGEVRFQSAVVGGNFYATGAFAESRKPDGGRDPNFVALRLSRARFDGTLYLSPPLELIGTLDLRGAKTERFADDPSCWPIDSHINLDGFTYEGFVGGIGTAQTPIDYETRKRWLERQHPNSLKGRNFKPQPWTQCARVLRAMGHGRDANKLLNTRDRLIVFNFGNFWTKLFYCLLWPFAGFGYKTHRSFFWALALILFGWLVFASAHSKGLIRPVPAPHQDFNALIYTLDVFVPVLDLHQETDWTIVEKSRPAEPNQSFWRRSADTLADHFTTIWLWAEIIMGWLLFGIVGAGLAGLFKHKTE